METGIDKEKLLHYKALAEKHLSNPKKFRLAVAAFFLLVGIFGIYLPFSKRIQETRKMLADERERNSYIMKVESLEKQSRMYKSYLESNTDTNLWVQYILDGLERFQVKLRDMESKSSRKVGMYEAVCLSLELEGNYDQLKGVIEWLEQSEHLLRIDSLRFEKRPDYLLMKVDVLGLMGKPKKSKVKDA